MHANNKAPDGESARLGFPCSTLRLVTESCAGAHYNILSNCKQKSSFVLAKIAILYFPL